MYAIWARGHARGGGQAAERVARAHRVGAHRLGRALRGRGRVAWAAGALPGAGSLSVVPGMTQESGFSPLAAASALSDTPWRAAMALSVSPGCDAVATAARGRRRGGRAGGGRRRADRRGRRLAGRGDRQVRAGDDARLGREAVGGGHGARRQVVGGGDAPERLAGGNGVDGGHGRRGHQGARGHRGQQGTEAWGVAYHRPAVRDAAPRGVP